MRLIDYFDRIAVINLPERADRRAQIDAELARLGLALNRAPVHLYRAVRPDGPCGFPSKGAHGAFMSHLGVLKEALHSNARNLLVLEDDAVLDGRFAHYGDRLTERLDHQPWSIAYFGHTVDEDPVRRDPLPRLEATTLRFEGAHCYAVHRDALPGLIAYLEGCLSRPPGHPEGGPMHFDGALTMFRRYQTNACTLLCMPSLSHQRASASDIAGTHWFERTPLLRQLAPQARAAKEALRSLGLINPINRRRTAP